MPFGHITGGKSSVAHVILAPTVVNPTLGALYVPSTYVCNICIGLTSSLLLLCRNRPLLPSKTTLDLAILPERRRIFAAKHPSPSVAPCESAKASATWIVVAKVNVGFGGAPETEDTIIRISTNIYIFIFKRAITIPFCNYRSFFLHGRGIV